MTLKPNQTAITIGLSANRKSFKDLVNMIKQANLKPEAIERIEQESGYVIAILKV